MSETCYNLYNSVYAAAHSIHEMLLQHVDTSSENDENVLEFNSWKVIILTLNGTYIIEVAFIM